MTSADQRRGPRLAGWITLERLAGFLADRVVVFLAGLARLFMPVLSSSIHAVREQDDCAHVDASVSFVVRSRMKLRSIFSLSIGKRRRVVSCKAFR